MNNLNNKKVLKTILLLSTFYFLLSGAVFAQDNVFYNQGNLGGSIGITNPLAGVADDIPGLIGYILYLARWIAGSIAVLMIIVGAYQILFSAGDPKGWETGKKTIIWAVVGFAIVLLAEVVVDIIRELVG